MFAAVLGRLGREVHVMVGWNGDDLDLPTMDFDLIVGVFGGGRATWWWWGVHWSTGFIACGENVSCLQVL